MRIYWLPDVASELNQRNSLHASEEAQKQGMHLGLETRERCHKKSGTRVSVAPQKDLCPPKILKKEGSQNHISC